MGRTQEAFFHVLTDNPPPLIEACLKGGEQAGKSHAEACVCAFYMHKYPDVSGVILVPKYENFDEGLGPRLREAYGIWDRDRWSEQKHVYRLPGKGMVYVETAERPVISITAGWICIEEPAQMPRVRYDDCQSRRRATGGPLWMGGTPESGHDWYAKWEKQARAGDPLKKLFEITAYDNPLISDEAIELARRDLSETEFRRRIMGESVNAEGLVYAAFGFDEDNRLGANMCDPPSDERMAAGEIWCGIDPGYSGAFAAVWELVERGKDILGYTQLADVKLQYVDEGDCIEEVVRSPYAKKVAAYVTDSADANFAQSLRKTLRERGLRAPVREVHKTKRGSQDFVPWSIGAQRRLYNRRIARIVRGRNEATLEELSLYRYGAPDENRRPDELPINSNNHCMDSKRYVVAETINYQIGSGPMVYPSHLGTQGDRHPIAAWRQRPKLSYRGVPLLEAARAPIQL